MDCPYCSLKASDQKVVLRDDLVWFVRDRRDQGSLKHSGVIIPVEHRETVFDLTKSEVAATFQLSVGLGDRAQPKRRLLITYPNPAPVDSLSIPPDSEVRDPEGCVCGGQNRRADPQ